MEAIKNSAPVQPPSTDETLQGGDVIVPGTNENKKPEPCRLSGNKK